MDMGNVNHDELMPHLLISGWYSLEMMVTEGEEAERPHFAG